MLLILLTGTAACIAMLLVMLHNAVAAAQRIFPIILLTFLRVHAAVTPFFLKNGKTLSLTIWQLGKNNLSTLALVAVFPSSKRL
jgi:hypothetical protein